MRSVARPIAFPRLVPCTTLVMVLAATTASAQPPGPPIWDVRVVEGQVEVLEIPPVELVDGASVRVDNEASDPVPVTLIDGDAVVPAELLPPGGRTIGGPGFFEAAVDESQHILGGFENSDRHLMCYTFVNFGPGGFSIFGIGHPAGDLQAVMVAGEQQTHCGLVSGVRVECDFGGQPCRGIYRVDLVE